MKLYLAPGACSLADHIALHEADIPFDRVRVDLKNHRTESGDDYFAINPKGYVPALEFDNGELLTENIAILSWIAAREGVHALSGGPEPHRLLEMLAFISTELHKAFHPLFIDDATEADKAAARKTVAERLLQASDRMEGDYLFGEEPTVADAYLYVMLRWAKRFGIECPAPLVRLAESMQDRPAVQLALKHEGLN